MKDIEELMLLRMATGSLNLEKLLIKKTDYLKLIDTIIDNLQTPNALDMALKRIKPKLLDENKALTSNELVWRKAFNRAVEEIIKIIEEIQNSKGINL